MRATVASVVLAACAIVGLAAQNTQPPVFRSGVEVVEVDVTVVDGNGKTVETLRAPEFSVTIDGQARRVISSEYVSDVDPASQQERAPVDPYISNNTDRRPGRLIVLVFDQNNLTMERMRASLTATRKFIDSLAVNDRVTLISIPAPGPFVDFTTDHERVKAALNGLIGRGDLDHGRHGISNYEAIVYDDQSDSITTQRMMVRLCGDASPSMTDLCTLDVQQDASEVALRIRIQAEESVSGLTSVLENLKEIDGPKSLILLTQGLNVASAQGEATVLAQIAAEARANVNVLLLDTANSDITERVSSTTPAADRDLRQVSLETFAARSRGALFHVAADPSFLFERISREIAGHYMLAVEPAVADRDGKQHRIGVKVLRQGLQVRARQQYQYPSRPPDAEARDGLMGRVLRSPSPATEIPMRVATYTYQDAQAGNGKVAIIVAAEMDPTTNGAVDVTIGHALYNQEGRPIHATQERKIYSQNSERPLRYEMSFSVDPGTYRLRIAAIDVDGHSGSVERQVQAWRTTGQDLALGDLMLAGTRDTQGSTIRPPVLLRVDDGQVATFTELYTSKPGSLEGVTVTFEIAEDADSPVLKSDVAHYRLRSDGASAQASAVLPVGALPPGRYVVRAMVSNSGRTVGKLVRPFVLLPGNRAAPVTAVVNADAAPPKAASASSAPVAMVPGADAGLVSLKPSSFQREAVLKPDVLRAVFDVMDKSHPSAKAALSKARRGQFEGTALMALEAGDQAAGAVLRGLELLSKGQLDPAATQFGVALRSAPDSALASFYLGACFAAGGKDREALVNWQRARAANVPVPLIDELLAGAWLRLDEPGQAVKPLTDALAKQPENDPLRKDLAVAQSQLGQHREAYATVVPYLATHPADADALLVALQAIYQVHAAGASIGTPEEDKTKAAEYARAYAAVSGSNQALVDKWLQFLNGAAK